MCIVHKIGQYTSFVQYTCSITSKNFVMVCFKSGTYGELTFRMCDSNGAVFCRFRKFKHNKRK